MDKVYQTGKKVATDCKETMRIVFDDYLPQWNYTAVPSGKAIWLVILSSTDVLHKEVIGHRSLKRGPMPSV